MKTISKNAIKIKLLKFFEIAYKENGEITAALIKDKGPFKLQVDNKGNAIISGKAGKVAFSVSEEIKEFGFDFKYASIMLSGNKQGMIQYRGTFGLMIEVEIVGFIDVEQLILNCSGLLCIAARAMKYRYQMIDKSIAGSLE